MRIAVALIWLSLLSACVPGSVIRHLPLYVPNSSFDKPIESVPNYPDTKIAYIELDDMGDLWKNRQVVAAENMIRDANYRASASKAGAIVLTYVHGWHQNADPAKASDASNLEMFKRILGWTTYDEILDARSSARPARPVVGVYIGWRGITGYWPLDYYNRNKAAGRVAGSAATEALLRITSVARENLQTRSIVVGHSMGALIVEHSLIPVLDAYLLKLKGRDARSQCEVRDARKYLPADLIVLINSAAHAIDSEKFIETLQNLHVQLKPQSQDNQSCKFFDDQKTWSLPLLMSITSEGDSSTRVILNLAAYPMTIAKAFRDYPKVYRGRVLTQRDLSLHSPGNFEPIASHWVRHEKLTAPVSGRFEVKPCTTFDGWKSDSSLHLPEDQIPSDASYRTLCFESTDDRGGDRFWVLQKRQTLNAIQSGGESQPSPYWIMHIPTTVVSDHSDIFTFPLDRFLRGMLRLTGAMGIVPTSCASEVAARCDSLNPDAVQTIVREPAICEPPPPLRLGYEGLESGCSTSNSTLCFRGETFRFHLERIDDGTPYRAKPCEAIQWDFADHSPVVGNDFVEHLFPANLELAAVEVKSPSANSWIPFAGPKVAATSIVPTIAYLGEKSKCLAGGPPCWQGELIRFEVKDQSAVDKATWSFDGERKHGTPVEHSFATIGVHEVHLGVAKGQRGGEATAMVPVAPHCSSPGDELAIQYRGELSGCAPGAGECLVSEPISFSLGGLPGGTEKNCFTVEWSYGDGTSGRGLSTTHIYNASKPVTVSAIVTSVGDSVSLSAGLSPSCPPPRPVWLDYLGELSGCSRATVSKGSRFCKLGESIVFSVTGENIIKGCADIQWSFLTESISDVQVSHKFAQLASSVTVQVVSAGERVLDAAPIRFLDPDGPVTVTASEGSSCPPLGRIAISYVGDKRCTGNRKCRPGERITFSIQAAAGLWSQCPADEIHWLFDDGSEQNGSTATKAFRRSKPAHSVHLVVLRNGRMATASTTVEVPLLKCNCSGGPKPI